MASWKDELRSVFEKMAAKTATEQATISEAQQKVAAWMASTARPALEEFAAELQANGREVTVGSSTTAAYLKVKNNVQLELDYTIEARISNHGHGLYVKTRTQDGGQTFVGETSAKSGSADTVETIGRDEVIQSVLQQYRYALRQY